MDGGVMAAATNQVVAGADLKADLARGAFKGSWTLVPSESSVWLKAKAMWGIVSVKGTFSELAGSAAVAADGGVTGRLEVKSASINTKMKKRDEHLRSDDFFACSLSDIVFEIDQVTSTTSGLTVEGRLTVRERTIRLEFPAVVTEFGSGQMGIDTALQVDRSELGLSYRGKGRNQDEQRSHRPRCLHPPLIFWTSDSWMRDRPEEHRRELQPEDCARPWLLSRPQRVPWVLAVVATLMNARVLYGCSFLQPDAA
jgi:polyisoprenoid-binding protein YceI